MILDFVVVVFPGLLSAVSSHFSKYCSRSLYSTVATMEPYILRYYTTLSCTTVLALRFNPNRTQPTRVDGYEKKKTKPQNHPPWTVLNMFP